MLPYNLDNYFPNLISIRVYASKLQTFTSLDLQPFPQMIVIDLDLNLLTSLESDLFKFTPNFKWVSFGSNQLSTVGRNLVTGQKNLEYLYFGGNKCINRGAKTKADVVTLNSDLPISCPAAITPVTCPTPCLQRADSSDSAIRKLNDEVAALKQTNVNQAKDITQLRETTVKQSNDIQQQRNYTNVLVNDIRILRESDTKQASEIKQINATSPSRMGRFIL